MNATATMPIGTLRRSAKPFGFMPLLLAAALLAGCREDPADLEEYESPEKANPDWTTASHGKAPPNYGLVFPQDSLNVIRIIMTEAEWSAIRQNMVTLWGFDFGTPAPPGGTFPPDEPQYVPVTVEFNGKRWLKAGFRPKGNSSLRAAWSRGIYKMPFRLNFDEFEEQWESVRNQHFHGFEELTFSAGYQDNSLLHEKLAADIFRMGGVPAARTALYRVFIDFGYGLRYCGVYAMVEVIEDTMVEDQYGESDGNIYKPTSALRTFNPAQFEKKNNELAADYGDVIAFVAALNDPVRAVDPAAWRAGLEATFDVDHFLKYLAINNTIVNWDSYGITAHNYYLYDRPGRGLTWIPWDHNEALTGNPGITGGSGTPGDRRGMSLSMNEISSNWPLVRYLATDSVYFPRYREHLRAFSQEVFTEAKLHPLIDRYHALVAPWAVGTEGEQPGYTFLTNPGAFMNSRDVLRLHVRTRHNLVASFLGAQ